MYFGKDGKMSKRKRRRKSERKAAKRDAFGSRTNSLRAKINAGLTTTPQTLDEIKKRQGLKTSNTFGEHLQSLRGAKLIRKDGDKYALTDKGAKAQKGK